MPAALTIKDLSKRFGAREAVQELSFEIMAGEIVSLVGPNGSGKSTTMKMVAGLLLPGSGHILIDGYDVAQQPLAAKARTGYIPDDPTIWSGMTGEELLHFTGALYGMEEADRLARMEELLPIFHLEAIASEYFADYSRGNRQKFAIIAALLHRPKLLLVDEPIVGLDPASITVAMQLFRDFADDGGAIFLIAHTLAVVAEVSDKIGLLRDGSLQAFGSLHELKKHGKNLEEIYTRVIAR
jgi:ABC-2 type transport system ATP-binding protein